MTERMLRRQEAAKYVQETYNLPCSPKTLAKIACISSDGPPFRMAGRFPLYPVSGLDNWAQQKIGPLSHSTSEGGIVGNAKGRPHWSKTPAPVVNLTPPTLSEERYLRTICPVHASHPWQIADENIPADVREFAARCGMRETMIEMWRGAFIEGLRYADKVKSPANPLTVKPEAPQIRQVPK